MDVCFACCKCSRAVSSHTLTAAGVEDHKYIGINKEGETTPTIQESSAHHHGPAGMPGGGEEGKEEEREESEDERTDEES